MRHREKERSGRHKEKRERGKMRKKEMNGNRQAGTQTYRAKERDPLKQNKGNAAYC